MPIVGILRCTLVAVGLLTLTSGGNSLVVAASAVQRSYGSFLGSPSVVFGPDGRTMTLQAKFGYIDPAGKRWEVPAGVEVDGASIPRPFWSFIGGPFEGTYRNASVVHDYYCDTRTEPWQDVHRMFYHAMLAGGTSSLKAKSMYYAVLVGGPRWSKVYYTNHPPRAIARPGDIDYYKMDLWEVTLDETTNKADLSWIQQADPDITAIEERAAKAFRGVSPPAKVRLDETRNN